MSDETLLDDLLSTWLDRFIGGEDVPAAALCTDHHDLIPEVEVRIEAQRQMLALARALAETDSSTAASPDPDSTLAECAGGLSQPSGITIPGYEVLAELGRGGMGTVCLARQLKPKRLVALKLLRADRPLNPDHQRRALDEADAIARLQHPHIVQIFDANEWQPAGSEAPQPYLALEYMSGGTLGRVLETQGALEPVEAARLLRLLAHAVHAAHRAGIVHRDLKPANVLLAPAVPGSPDNFPFGFPKINDFGLARLLDIEQRHTLDGLVMGSPTYMAPEQADGRRDVGPAADIWALGVILYECLTGQQPFKGDSALATLDLVRSGTPVPPRSPHGEVPAALEAICLRCLRKDPADRYPSADELAEDLHKFLARETISARPEDLEPPRPDRRRRPSLIAGVLVLVAGAALALTLSPWGHRQPNAAAPVPFAAQPIPPSSLPPLKGSIDIVVYESAMPGQDKFEPSKARQGLRLHERRALPLQPNDWIRIEAEMNRPAYLYVVWIDTDGKVTPLWPWEDGNWTRLPRDQTPRHQLTLPDLVKGEAVMPLSGGPAGIESLLLLARETPLTAAENPEVMRILGRPLPRQSMALSEADVHLAVWLENGERVTDEPTRAPILSKAQPSGDPEVQVRSVMKQLQSLFPYTRAVCFGNQGSR